MKKKPILILGTGSHVGKTTLVSGLCRLFASRGYRVAPFKAQNMSLNCYVTEDNREIALATALQARGAMREATVDMNPLLLKPKGENISEWIIHGEVFCDVSAEEYFVTERWQKRKWEAIEMSLSRLFLENDLIIGEGAGSCAEPNLREFDVVNMGLAHRMQADVFIVLDIDKGGVFAEALGTIELLRRTSPEDIPLIKGFLINKFRGDPALLTPAIRWLEKETKIPVTGVIPFVYDIALSQEDRLIERRCEQPEIDIAVIYLPHISNTSDFDDLSFEKKTRVRFVKTKEELGFPDAVILPGTKNTISDLLHLRKTGLEEAIRNRVGDVFLLGICGGYEMLGSFLIDEKRRESTQGSIAGMGLFPFSFFFSNKKTVRRVTYEPTEGHLFSSAGRIQGYEIHTGMVQGRLPCSCYALGDREEGFFDETREIFGTFVHNLFTNHSFTRSWINHLRQKKGLSPLKAPFPNVEEKREEEYRRWADILYTHSSWSV